MKHIKTLNTQTLNNTVKKGGCGECQTSCQSACKTSCTVGNQTCENRKYSGSVKKEHKGVRQRAGKSAALRMYLVCTKDRKRGNLCDTPVSE